MAIASSGEEDAVSDLTAQLAVTTGKLRAAEERVEQLEKLLKVCIEEVGWCAPCTQQGVGRQRAGQGVDSQGSRARAM